MASRFMGCNTYLCTIYDNRQVRANIAVIVWIISINNINFIIKYISHLYLRYT